MAKLHLHSRVGARLVRVGAVAATLMLGATICLTVASAQAPKKAPDKSKAAAPPEAPTASTQSAWVKLCDKGTATLKNKEGKEEKKDLSVCMTHHERIDGSSGMVLVSAALQQTQVDGQEKQHFKVMVPLGMLLQPGMRATVFPKDLWEKAQKNEKIEKNDEAKLKGLKLDYTLCHAVGCTAEMEATPELLTSLKGSGGLMVFVISASGAPVGFAVPLAGFEQALSGQPVDTKKYAQARTELMKQIAQRQQELQQELKKQQDDLNKMQPNVAPPPKGPTPPAKK